MPKGLRAVATGWYISTPRPTTARRPLATPKNAIAIDGLAFLRPLSA